MDWDLAVKALTAMAPVLVILIAFDRLDIFNLIRFRTITSLIGVGGGVAAASFLVNWRVMDGFPIGFSGYSRYVAPIVEETLKAAPIIALFAMNRLGFKLDSAIAGFAIGAGFSMVENAWYLYALPGANFTAWLVRGFGAAIMHGGAASVFAVISHEMTERQAQAKAADYNFSPLLFVPGLGLAIVIHSAFNHFPNDPLIAMAVTLMLVPSTLFIVFARSEAATRHWLKADQEAHHRALEEIRGGDFKESVAGRSLTALLANRFASANTADVFAYVEAKMELVLRAEGIMLAAQEGGGVDLAAEREKFARLETLEERLGRPLLTAIALHLGFSRNDLWELERLKARVLEATP